MRSFFHLMRRYGYVVMLMLMVSVGQAQVPYSSIITSLVKKSMEELTGELQPGSSIYKKLAGACTGNVRDGQATVQKFLNSQLASKLRKSIADIFARPELLPRYFGKRPQETVVNDALTEISSQNTAAQVAALVNKICGSSVPSRTHKNRPPKAYAGKDQFIMLPVNITTLSGKGDDPDNDQLQYRWEKLGGQDNEKIISPGSQVTRIENLRQGIHQYVLNVTDTFGATGRDTIMVTVKAATILPPTANAGSDIVVILPLNKVTLRGSGADPNGLPIIFRWEKLSSRDNDQIVSTSSPETAITNLREGVHQYVLIVTNKNRLTARDTVSVNVKPPLPEKPPQTKNSPPRAFAGNDASIRLPVNQITLTGRGEDPDHDRLLYEWTMLPGRRPFQRGPRAIMGKLSKGVHYFVLKVTDEHGAFDQDTVMITVNPAILIPPVADAGIDQQAKLTDEGIVLKGSGKDKDGVISAYQWTKVSGPGSFHIVSATDSQTVVNQLVKGNYEFQLKVTDNDGLTATDTVLLQLYSPPARSLLWIGILGVILAMGSSYTIYVLWWRGKREKIIVYFLSDSEKQLVNELMPDGHKTDGYVTGNCSRGSIKKMRKKGLPLRILNARVLTVNTPGVSRTYKFSSKKGEPQLESETREEIQGNFVNLIATPPQNEVNGHELPAFYIITLDTPLLPAFKEKLQNAGVHILQRVPYDSYIILVRDEDQLHKLQDRNEFEFIRVLHEYSPEDTGFIVRKDHPDKLVVDLLLHRDEDTGTVREFLRANEIEQIASYRNTIRVRISPDRDIAYKLASNKYIQAIYEHVHPVWHNNIARQLTGIDAEVPGETFVTENGDGQIIAVADTGIDRNHPDLADRLIAAVAWGRKATDDTSDPHGHGTHVTGSIVGNGNASAGEIKGMAPGAKIFFQSLLDENEQLCDLELQLPALLGEAYRSGARIVNISWGSATESFYTFDSVAMDRFVYENPEMLVVVSAGNEGVAGFGSIGSPATTKNGLTVGASRNRRKDEDPESVAAFSSRGPCRSDRRIKPDIVAPGTNILSVKSSLAPNRNFEAFYINPAYVFMGGTSMATPIISGVAALVREYFNKTKSYATPSAALIKATLLNGTRRLTAESAMEGSDIIPNNNQGFGMTDLSMTIPNKQRSIKLEFCDSLQDPALPFRYTGERRMFRLMLPEKTWIRACLVFIDNPAMGMQSDLDLIIGQEATIQKWTGNAGINVKEAYLSSKQEDFTNNTEIIRIDDAEAGSYIIEVVATIVAPEGNPVFALVVTTGDLSSEFSIEAI